MKTAPDTFLSALNRMFDKKFFQNLRFAESYRDPLAMSVLKNAMYDHLVKEGSAQLGSIKITEAQQESLSLKIAQAVNEFAPSVFALACWQLTKNIYTYHIGLSDPLKRAKLNKVPVSVIEARPEACVYIDHCIADGQGNVMQGFFVYVERSEDGTPDLLRFLFMAEKLEQSLAQGNLSGMFLSLPLSHEMTFEECIEASLQATRNTAVQGILSEAPETVADYQPLRIALPLFLYLCSEDPDFGGEIPLRPLVRRTKQGLVAERPKQATAVSVGPRIGRYYVGKAAGAVLAEPTGTGTKVVPHIRAPHFQHYYVGSRLKGEQKAILKYVAAYTVGDFEEPVTTIRKVTPRR